MNTEQQTTQNKQHRYTQDNTNIHKTTQIYTRQHRYTQENTDICAIEVNVGENCPWMGCVGGGGCSQG
jgi:hypothetical protein